MKKINLFNRNTNLPSYRRMPVSSGIAENRHTAEARCPGIAIAMTCPAGDFSSQGDEKHNVCDASFCIRKNWIPAFAGMTMIVIAALFATPSFAEPTELDKKTVASKAYVDTKQDKITTDLVTFHEPEENIDYTVPALVSYGTGTNNGDGVLGNKIGILGINQNVGGLSSWDFLDLWDDSESAYLDNFVPTVRAVASAVGNIWSKLNSININSKQDKLPAAWTSATNSTSMGANANSGGQTIELNTLGSVKRRYIAGIGSQPLTKKSGGDNLILYVKGKKTLDAFEASNFGGTSTTIINTNKNYIKGALVSLELLKDTYSALRYDIPAEIYPVLDTSTTDWAHMAPSVSYVGGQIMTLSDTAGAAERRYIAPATGNAPLTQKTDADGVILYINGTKTPQEYRISNFGNSSDNVTALKYIRGALVTLGLLRDVYSELDSKITNNALPTGTTGTVVTYNGVNAETGVQQFTETAISGTATYDDNDQLTNGNNIANVSLVETEIATRQKKRTCAGYEPGHENEADYCWLWNFPD